jgi:hypothetical protein
LDSTSGYEDYLRNELGQEVVEDGLAEKREEMTKAAFSFLRASYWRWAETVLIVVPELAEAPRVLAVGDIHLENFGTWRDADGRLIWGVNDYDEAADMPYVLDLLRLATSALLASSKAQREAVEDIADPLLDGYSEGLKCPSAAVLDRELDWLRQAVMVHEVHRSEFWKKLKKKQKKFEDMSPSARPRLWWRYETALRAALPVGAGEPQLWSRSAGLGSLGRPRWVAQARWCGDWVLREAKGMVPSAWTRAHPGAGRAIRCMEIATGRYRAPDPWYRVIDGVAVRRLSPNNHKIEVDRPAAPKQDEGPEQPLGRDVLLAPKMLKAMGRELAAVHLGTGDVSDRIEQDLKQRGSKWLVGASLRMVQKVTDDYQAFQQQDG